MGAADDGQSNGASLLGLGDRLGCAGRSLGPSSCAAELLCVGKDEVHVLCGGQSRRVSKGLERTLSKASICPTICLLS